MFFKNPMEVFNLYLKYLDIFLTTAWAWLPFVLAVVFFHSWMYYARRLHWRQLDWALLEIKPPKDVETTPKNMEHIFAGLWGSSGTVGNKKEKYLDGKLQDYFSLEIAGVNGEIHFYIRTLRKFRDLVEAQVYSQFPQAEIKEVADYTLSMPMDIPNKNWDLWGCRLILARDSVYPIRTFQHFMDLAKDQVFFDPLAGLMEVLGKLRQGEQAWIQIFIRPIADTWQEKARKLADKLLGKIIKEKEGVLKTEIRTWREAISNVVEEFIIGKPATDVKKQEATGPASLMMFLSPGERDVIEGIEDKASKKGYEAKMQWAYFGRRDIFTMANVSAVMGLFNQYANLNMNSLKPDPVTMTKANYILAKLRKTYKQRVLMRLLRQRSFWERGYIFNIEELATLYHFPTKMVQAPMTPYIPVKKGGAPVGLPTE